MFFNSSRVLEKFFLSFLPDVFLGLCRFGTISGGMEARRDIFLGTLESSSYFGEMDFRLANIFSGLSVFLIYQEKNFLFLFI